MDELKIKKDTTRVVVGKGLKHLINKKGFNVEEVILNDLEACTTEDNLLKVHVNFDLTMKDHWFFGWLIRQMAKGS